jgi:hypothetical protein
MMILIICALLQKRIHQECEMDRTFNMRGAGRDRHKF